MKEKKPYFAARGARARFCIFNQIALLTCSKNYNEVAVYLKTDRLGNLTGLDF